MPLPGWPRTRQDGIHRELLKVIDPVAKELQSFYPQDFLTQIDDEDACRNMGRNKNHHLIDPTLKKAKKWVDESKGAAEAVPQVKVLCDRVQDCRLHVSESARR